MDGGMDHGMDYGISYSNTQLYCVVELGIAIQQMALTAQNYLIIDTDS